MLLVGQPMPDRSKGRSQTNIVRKDVTGSRVMVEDTGRWYRFSTGCSFMCSFEDKPLKLAEYCAWNVLKQVSKYLNAYPHFWTIMAINQNPRRLVPGTRKRRGTKNQLVKNKNNRKKGLKTKNQKIFINIGTWNSRNLNNEGNLDLS